jgi:hypothetical protein
MRELILLAAVALFVAGGLGVIRWTDPYLSRSRRRAPGERKRWQWPD